METPLRVKFKKEITFENQKIKDIREEVDRNPD